MKKRVQINVKMVIIALIIILIISPTNLFVNISKASSDLTLSYKMYYTGYGWVLPENNLENINNRAIEAIKIDINSDNKEDLVYSVYTGKDGWLSSVNSGKATGKISRNTPLERIRIDLSSAMEQKYEIEYRVCNADNFWTKWYRNGEATIDSGNAIYNLEIRLIEK